MLRSIIFCLSGVAFATTSDLDVELRLFNDNKPRTEADGFPRVSVKIRGKSFDCFLPSERSISKTKDEYSDIRSRRMGFLDGACEHLENIEVCYGSRVSTPKKHFNFSFESLFTNGSAEQRYISSDNEIFSVSFVCSTSSAQGQKISENSLQYLSPFFCDYRINVPPIAQQEAQVWEYPPMTPYRNLLNPLSNSECLDFLFGPSTASFCYGRSFSHYYLQDDGMVDVSSTVNLGKFFIENSKSPRFHPKDIHEVPENTKENDLSLKEFNPSELFGATNGLSVFMNSGGQSEWIGTPRPYLAINRSQISAGYQKMALKVDVGGGDECEKARVKATGPAPSRNTTISFFCSSYPMTKQKNSNQSHAVARVKMMYEHDKKKRFKMGEIEQHLKNAPFTMVEFFTETSVCEYDLRIATPLVCASPQVTETEANEFKWGDDVLVNEARKAICYIKDNANGEVGARNPAEETSFRKQEIQSILKNYLAENNEKGQWY